MRNKVQYKMISQSSRIYSNHKYMWIYFRVPKYIKQITYLKGEIHSNTIIADNFSTPLSAIDSQAENQKGNFGLEYWTTWINMLL